MKTTSRFLHLLVVLTISLLFLTLRISAQWSHDPNINTPISTGTGNQVRPALIGDGSGGAIITWNDYRNGNFSDVYAQRVDSGGIALWNSNGVVINNANIQPPITPNPPAIVSDGEGGAIIVWHDFRGNRWTIYAQRINSSGIVQWEPNGVAFSFPSWPGPWVQLTPPAIISDGKGGAILVWGDFRDTKPRLSAQHINGSGVVQWNGMGVLVCDTVSTVVSSLIIGDGKGGAIISWIDNRIGNSTQLYSQHINAFGVRQWGSNGKRIWGMGGLQTAPTIIDDGGGGAFITWKDHISGSANLYTQHVDSTGSEQWNQDAVVISTTAVTGTSGCSLVRGMTGEIIVVWSDRRNTANVDIYAQCINTAGVAEWNSGGIAIAATGNNESVPVIISDTTGGVIVAWGDDNQDLYAQKVNASGDVQWGPSGVLLCKSAASYPAIVSDCAGGMIVTWETFRDDIDDDIYAQQISVSGDLGGLTDLVEAQGWFLTFRLNQNYPNPFNSNTKINFSIPEINLVTLRIYNMFGQEIATLVEDYVHAGYHEIEFDGSNLSSGIYFYKLKAGNFCDTKKFVLLK